MRLAGSASRGGDLGSIPSPAPVSGILTNNSLDRLTIIIAAIIIIIFVHTAVRLPPIFSQPRAPSEREIGGGRDEQKMGGGWLGGVSRLKASPKPAKAEQNEENSGWLSEQHASR